MIDDFRSCPNQIARVIDPQEGETDSVCLIGFKGDEAVVELPHTAEQKLFPCDRLELTGVHVGPRNASCII